MTHAFHLDDTESVGNLELSVRSENVLNRAGIKTIGQLRRLTEDDFARMRDQQGRSSVTAKVRRDIADALKEWDAGADKRKADADRDFQEARAMFSRLPVSRQMDLFKEFGRCGCSDLAKLVKDSPAVGIGALVGGILGALVETKPKCADCGSSSANLLKHACGATTCTTCRRAYHEGQIKSGCAAQASKKLLAGVLGK